MVGEVVVVSYFYCELKSRLLTHPPGEHPGECGAQPNLVDTHGPPPTSQHSPTKFENSTAKQEGCCGIWRPLVTWNDGGTGGSEGVCRVLLDAAAAAVAQMKLRIGARPEESLPEATLRS